MYEDVTHFCEELTIKAFEGMCVCVCIHVIEWLKVKVERYEVLITTQ